MNYEVSTKQSVWEASVTGDNLVDAFRVYAIFVRSLGWIGSYRARVNSDVTPLSSFRDKSLRPKEI